MISIEVTITRSAPYERKCLGDIPFVAVPREGEHVILDGSIWPEIGTAFISGTVRSVGYSYINGKSKASINLDLNQ